MKPLKKSSLDLTEGNIVLQVLAVAMPVLLGQLLQNLYHSVDSIIVGNFVGKTALAAVTSCGDISLLIVSFFTGFSIGAGVLFSNYFGAKEYEKLSRAIHTALLSSALLGLLMAAVGIVVTPPILRLIDCPASVFPEAVTYLQIYFVGVFFTSVYNVAAGILRSVGNTKDSLYYLIAACATNVVLDLVFVKCFGMGVEGVALATVAAQLLSVCLIFKNMLSAKEDVYQFKVKKLGIDLSILRDIIRLGFPAAIQSCLVVFSNLFIQRYINGFGSSAMAGVGVAKKIDKFVSEISKALGMSAAAFVGQNIGAQKYERTYQGIRCILAICLISMLCMAAPIYLFAPALVRVFTDDQETIYYGTMMVKTIVPLCFLHSLHQVFANVIRGFGRSAVSMVLGILGMIVFRQAFLAISMHVSYGIQNVYYSYPVGWGSAALLSGMYYWLFLRHKAGKVKGQPPTVPPCDVHTAE